MYGVNLFDNETVVDFMQPYSRRVLVVDRVVEPQVSQLCHLWDNTIAIDGGEGIKTRQSKEHIENQLIAYGCDKDTLLVAVGGGTVLDVAGFVAATYYRGIDVCYFPSTLLAMVDAAIGGKNGLNVGEVKNCIGTIYYPRFVGVDVAFLNTLPDGEMQNGCVEMAKHAILCDDVYRFDAALSAILMRDTTIVLEQIEYSVRRKIVFLDIEIRDILNFGHTLGHAIEVLSGYTIPHGQAVAIGIIGESMLSHLSGYLPLSEYTTIESLIKRIGLPLKIPQKYPFNAWMEALLRDKKVKHHSPYFVLLERMGKPLKKKGRYCHAVDRRILQEVISTIC